MAAGHLALHLLLLPQGRPGAVLELEQEVVAGGGLVLQPPLRRPRRRRRLRQAALRRTAPSSRGTSIHRNLQPNAPGTERSRHAKSLSPGCIREVRQWGGGHLQGLQLLDAGAQDGRLVRHGLQRRQAQLRLIQLRPPLPAGRRAPQQPIPPVRRLSHVPRVAASGD